MSSHHASGRTRGVLAVACGTALAAVALAPAAGAAATPVIQNVHFNFTYTHIEQEIGECLDVPFAIRHDGRSNARLQVRTHGTDGPEYLSLRYTTGDVYTNVETGESFTGTTSVREADLKVTEHGDGTITVVAASRGTTKFHDPSGALIAIDSGRVTSTYLIDLMEPADPEDDIVLAEEHSEPTGTSSLGEVDVCGLAVEYLT